MAFRPLTPAEQESTRRAKLFMLKALGILLAIMILLAFMRAARDPETFDPSRHPVLGVIPAGVSMHPGAWSGIPSSCTWDPVATSAALDRFEPGQPIERSVDGIRYRPYVHTCESSDRVVWTPERSPAALAGDGRSSLIGTIPRPEIGSASPSSDATVQTGMWFWTDTPFEAKSVTAWVPGPDGAVWATTTATPTRLVIHPGDGPLGTGEVVCEGPGEPWLPGYGDELVSACMYTYLHSSAVVDDGEPFLASMSIEWDVTWTSSTGAGGVLDPIGSSAATRIEVREMVVLR